MGTNQPVNQLFNKHSFQPIEPTLYNLQFTLLYKLHVFYF